MRSLSLAPLLLASCVALRAPAPPPIPAGEDPARWTEDVAALAAQPATAEHPVVFVGSSSIRLWDTLATDMAPMPVLNCGFGGSRLFDTVHWAEPLVAEREPAVVVVFAGTNDLAGSTPREPEWLLQRFDELVARLTDLGCEAPLVYIAISPTPARAEHQGLVEETNRLIAARCASSPRLTFVDTASALLDAQGRPDPRWFRGDGLHLNSEGYALWAAALRPVVWELYEARRPQAHGPRSTAAPGPGPSPHLRLCWNTSEPRCSQRSLPSDRPPDPVEVVVPPQEWRGERSRGLSSVSVSLL